MTAGPRLPLLLTVVAITAANFMNVLDTTIAVVSLPAISGSLGATSSQGAWALTPHSVCLAVIELPELPELARGKGSRIISIPAAQAQSREEFIVAATVVDSGQELVLHADKRHIAIPYRDLEHYRGKRGRRGNKLPRGLQKVERAEVRG
ncbi:MAG: hypothetical protein IPH23_04475 [Gammaproteobacteria bacterium]|nr:hypothetical protein [Gammaproteobacteria bacterium]